MISYTLDAQDIITSVNPAFQTFAEENNAPFSASDVLGRSIFKSVTGHSTRTLYEAIYRFVRESGVELQIPYRCDSPTHRRHMSMVISRAQANTLEVRNEQVECVEKTYPSVGVRHVASDAGRGIVRVARICSICNHLSLRDGEWLELDIAVETYRSYFDVENPYAVSMPCERCIAGIAQRTDAAQTRLVGSKHRTHHAIDDFVKMRKNVIPILRGERPEH